jgi:hypothetical protein
MTPTFMRDDVPIQEPKLDLDAFVVGSPVVVSLPRYRANADREKVPAEVTAKARVWVTVTETGRERPNSWRFRLDTQDEGNRDFPQYNARFRTPEQEIHHAAVTEANAYLSQQGIRLDLDSPWRKTPWDTLRLARMIWRAENGDE